ncbi:DUF4491 domain-containing protein [Parabacteroides sp. An277]|uniref:DUF4491 family protein n=1 Tax=Parabacteroides sp. An277 TaxID=1965619 RepID=UPI000B39A557|nr:DUF4491 family protein [Parabacteroides sp. An277]OUO51344.1 DUF4491 domain-containing protein [Parabacteroides sp. An277]
MNGHGLLIGVVTFLVIGLFHPLVVKAEYYWGTRSWWLFLLAGIVAAGLSLLIENILLSTICGVFAFSSFWSIKEVFEQEERVLKGWFPKNPKRTYPEKGKGNSV